MSVLEEILNMEESGDPSCSRRTDDAMMDQHDHDNI
jgi:hypothetical protein